MKPNDVPAPDSPPSPVLAVGSEFAGYRVIHMLGRGGMGEVYEVEHLHLGERYALKVLNAEIAEQDGARDRFLTEARVMARLDHRNLVKVGDCRETDGKLWLRMELAPGLEMSDGRRIVSLADLLDAYDGRPMKPDFVRGVLDGILAGLGAAHAADLIHRDLKPSNILLWPDGRPKISDFGLVRVVNQEWRASKIRFVAESVPGMGMAPAGSATRALLGSYEFMSPEQKRGLEADARSDLYAVGLMAFRMLTGHDTPGMEVASSLVPGLDPKWDAWLVWLLKPDPRMRCPGVKEALAALPGTGTVKPPPPNKLKNRKRTSLTVAWVIGVAAVLGLVAWAALNKDKPPRARTVESAVDEAAIQRERAAEQRVKQLEKEREDQKKQQADENARADARVAAAEQAANERAAQAENEKRDAIRKVQEANERAAKAEQEKRAQIAEASAAAIRPRIAGVWRVEEQVAQSEGGWVIVWSYKAELQGDTIALTGKKVSVNGKIPTQGEAAAVSTMQLQLQQSQADGDCKEVNFRGEELRSRVSIRFDSESKSFRGACFAHGQRVSELSGTKQ